MPFLTKLWIHLKKKKTYLNNMHLSQLSFSYCFSLLSAGMIFSRRFSLLTLSRFVRSLHEILFDKIKYYLMTFSSMSFQVSSTYTFRSIFKISNYKLSFRNIPWLLYSFPTQCSRICQGKDYAYPFMIQPQWWEDPYSPRMCLISILGWI